MQSYGINQLERVIERSNATDTDWKKYFEACEQEGVDAQIRFVDKCHALGKYERAKPVVLKILSDMSLSPKYICFDYADIKYKSAKRLVFNQGLPVMVRRLDDVLEQDRRLLRYLQFSKGGTDFFAQFCCMEQIGHKSRRGDDQVLNDDDAERIAQVVSIHSVNLQYSDITDYGADKLLALPNIKRLKLNYSNVTNKIVSKVCAKDLADVSLKGTRISDSGARYLAKNLKSASNLELSDCRKMTKKGIDALCESDYKALRIEGERLRRIYDRC
ncbi:hypothetical protein J4219_05840 [Candidatus Woesearchaeota archaeon]|nr:hypothetical protein [Candidatus Woesearchaeota archaeon]